MEALRNFFLPPAKSTMAQEVDAIFWFVHISSLVLTIGILIALAYFIVKYRRKSENDVTPVITHNNRLEVTWSVIPLIIVLVVFGWGFQTYINLTTPPDDAYEIQVTAQKWFWNAKYENGAQTQDEIHVPAGRPVKLVMQSSDVIHSFYVPDYRIKQDVVPNRYTETWFEAEEAGESIVFCTEYCGTDHSNMDAKVIVHEEDEYEDWLAENEGGGEMPEDMAPEEWGEQLAQQYGCQTCHSVDGSDGQGPSWQGIHGSTRDFEDGSSTEVDDNYLRESILEPGAKVVEGYDNIMSSYQGQLNDDQIDAIIEYIKTLEE